MTDRESLYAAVLAAPDDDTPRLVYADYLDDTGERADALRAEFIRVGVGVAREEAWSPGWRAFSERAAALRSAADGLGDKKTHPWAKHLAGRVKAWDYDRGLIGQVTVFSKRFVAEAAKFLAADPLRTVRFVTLNSTVGAAPLADLLRCPHLARLTRLGFDGSEFTDPTLDRLAASPQLAGIRGLSLGGRNRFGPAALPRLLASLPELSEVRFRGNESVTTAHAEHLAVSKNLARLRVLDLGETRVGPTGVRALATSPHATALEFLDLTAPLLHDEEHGLTIGYQRNAAEATALADALGEGAWPNLRELVLTGRNLGDNGLRRLSTGTFPALRRLTIDGADVTWAGVEALARAAFAGRLWRLSFGFCTPLANRRAEVAALFPSAEVTILGATS